MLNGYDLVVLTALFLQVYKTAGEGLGQIITYFFEITEL